MNENRFFGRSDTRFIKGIAIILMVALHRLKPEWMINPGLILDLSIRNVPVSVILARSADICIGIFAFISGYGWYYNFSKKSRIRRIFGITDGIFPKYWLSLLIVSFPARLICDYFIQGIEFKTTYLEIIRSILALSSKSSQYCWYILFFAIAVLTFPLFKKWISNSKMHALGLIILTLGVSFIIRIADKLFISRISILSPIQGIITHYIQWIPAILLGSICAQTSLFERLQTLCKKNISLDSDIIGLLIAVLLYLLKVIIQFTTNVYTNIDCIIIIPVVYGLVCMSHILQKKWNGSVFRGICFLGDYSFYIWMTHGILKYNIFQRIIYATRFPIIILTLSILIVLPFCYLLKILEKALVKAVRRH